MGDFEADLDDLASELNLVGPQRNADIPGSPRSLELWLRKLRDVGGHDLLLIAGAPPVIRSAGRLLPTSEIVLGADDIESAAVPLIPIRLHETYRRGAAIDVAFTVRGLGRFRMNLHRERNRPAAAIRALPLRVPTIADLHFTHDVAMLSSLQRGLVLFGGPAGSGRTTTLAAVVGEINGNNARHIVTIEDSIEYEHTHLRSLVEQIEIGVDAPDCPTALRSALRQAPDVIVIGEMRDPETMRLALAAAETNHLVLATVHATDVGAAISRIIDSFPPEAQNTVRQELAMSLAAAMTQTLIPTLSGSLTPGAELLMVSHRARQHIRSGALTQLYQEIAMTRKAGSFTMEESLARLVERGVMDWNEARLRAPHPEALDPVATL